MISNKFNRPDSMIQKLESKIYPKPFLPTADCDNELINGERYHIPDTKLTASSSLSSNHTPIESRLIANGQTK